MSNKPDRAANLEAIINDCSASGRLPKKVAESVGGKLQFMELQVFGKVGRANRRALDDYINGKGHSPTEILDQLAWALEWIKSAEPRGICPPSTGSVDGRRLRE